MLLTKGTRVRVAQHTEGSYHYLPIGTVCVVSYDQRPDDNSVEVDTVGPVTSTSGMQHHRLHQAVPVADLVPDADTDLADGWAVRVSWNTEADGRWADEDDPRPYSLYHSARWATAEDAAAWMETFTADDTDINEAVVISINLVTP